MPFDPQRVKAVLFDVDGTLSDSDELWTERMERWLRPIRFILPNRDPHPVARRIIMALESPGNAVYHILDQAGLDLPLMHLLQRLQRSPRHSKAVYQMQNGTTALLDALLPLYPLAVVSARDETSTLSFLNHFDLQRYFKIIVTGQTCRYTKPFPDPILWTAEKLGVRPEECVMVGDTSVDIHAGKAAGAQTVGVLCGFGIETELRRAGADAILEATEELQGILYT